MNRTYRLVWNRTLRVLQVASELAHGRGADASPARSPRPLARRLLALACLAACAVPVDAAMAACSPTVPTAGATVTCSGVANPLAPSYAASANNLTVNVLPGGTVGVLQSLGGTAMSLSGNGTTLNNGGTIDPSLYGLLSLLSSGTVIGDSDLGTAIPGSTVIVNNSGVMNGTTGLLGLNLPDLTGMALAVRNGSSGTTTISNAGVIGSNALLGVSVLGADAPVVAAYGGGQVNFTNTGSITGRVAFEASSAGNSFINQGSIVGSVSLGANSTNTFVAVTGSVVDDGGSLGGNPLGVLGTTLYFAPTGQIDGGSGGNNTLVLQNSVSGTGSGPNGTGTIAASNYFNFQHLVVNSGTWSLLGAVVSGDATLNDGVVTFNNGNAFGFGRFTANGGTLGASTGGVTMGNPITINTHGLTALANNSFTLSGVISGDGALTKDGAATLTLTGANTYTGDTIVNDGSLALSGTGSLWSSGKVVLAGGSTFDISSTSGDATIGSLAGGSGTVALGARTLTLSDNTNTTFSGNLTGTGGIVKQGTGAFTLAGTNTYTGGTTIDAGKVAIDNGGSLASAGAVTLAGATAMLDVSAATTNPTIGGLSGVAGSHVVLGNNTLTFGNAANQTFAGTIEGAGGIVKQGSGTLTLSGVNAYTGGTTINAGTLALGAGTSLAAQSQVTLATNGTFDISATSAQAVGGLAGTGGTVNLGANTLTLATSGTREFSGAIAGSGGVVVSGTGQQILSGANVYTGGTSILSGTLALGAGGRLAAGGSLTLAPSGTFDISAAGNQSIGVLAGTGGIIELGGNTLSVSGSGGGSFDGVIHGSGGLANVANALVLNGASTYTGPTQVQGGSLTVGDAAHAGARVGGDVSVASGAALGGFGSIGGDVSVLAGGHLSPGAPTGTLTVDGDLTMAQGSLLDFSFGAPGPNFSTPGIGHNVVVAGDLAINGASLSAIDAGGFGPGLYNLFSYGGSLTETNGGVIPLAGVTIQNLTSSKQINLINTNGLVLNFWNANGLASASQMGGGSGTWSAGQANWTNATGSVTSIRQPADAFAIFGGAAGTVTIDNGAGGLQQVSAQGLQFASDGYVITGGGLALAAPSAGALSEIRVGDGSAASAGWTATIDATLTGAGLNKTGAGTLVLNGVNAYAQGTMLSAGTLSVGSDASLGLAGAGLDFEGGVLRVTGTSFTNTQRAITLGAAGGGLDIADAGNTFTVSQALAGGGSLTKLGAGTLVLTGANSYGGGTTVAAGTLQGDTTSLQGNIVDNAALVFAQGADGVFGGHITGSGSLTKAGAGTLVLGGANSYGGGTTIQAGTLQGDAGSLQGSIVNQSALVFDQRTDGTFNGSINGTGSLGKTGAGTLILHGANSYGGGTTVAAGTLQGDAASLQGAILDNGVLVFDQGADGVFHGAVSGSGSLTKRGAGTLTLTAANTYGGGTTIEAGALRGDADSLHGDIVNNASLIFDQSADATFGGVISGSGTLTKQGAGTLTLTAANTYGGGTVIDAGALRGDTGSLQGNVLDHASLVFDQGSDGTFGGAISGEGSVTKLGAGTLTLTGANRYAGGTVLGAGTLRGDTASLQGAIANDAALIFDQQDDGVFNGTLSGNGSMAKQGAGSLTLDSANTLAGPVRVAAGTLVVGDDSHAGATLPGTVTVDSGARLAGIGTIGALDASGTIKPGNSPGTLHVTGQAVFRAGSILQVEASPDGQVNTLAVGGSASILGGSVLVLAQPGNYAPRTDYTILTAAQGVTGQFGAVSANLLFLTPVLGYSPDAVTLSLQRNDIRFDSVAQTVNQVNTAAALDSLDASSAIYNALLTLDAAHARQAFDRLSGEMHASIATALFDDGRYVRDAINNHLLGAGYGGQQAEGRTADGNLVWTSLWTHGGDHDADGNAHAMDANGSGLLLGGDLPFDALRIGGALGHGQSSLHVDDVGSSAHAKVNDASVYAAWNAGPWRLQGGATYAWQSIDTTRRLAVGTFAGTAHASYDAHTAQAYIDGGYVFQAAHGTVEPYVNLSRVHLGTDAFAEHGGDAALAVDASSADLTTGALGLRGTWSLDPGGLHAYAGASWEHAWGDRLPERRERFAAGADSFSVYGVPVADDAGVLDLGLRFPLSRAVTADLGYHGQFASGARDQSARLTVSVAF